MIFKEIEKNFELANVIFDIYRKFFFGILQ